jgi:hypothetical protein
MMGDFCWFLHREDGMYIRYEVFTLVNMKSTIFCNVTLCSPVVVHECFVGTYASIFRLCLPPDSCWAYSLTPKIYAVYSSEMLMNLCQITQCYIPEGSILWKMK